MRIRPLALGLVGCAASLLLGLSLTAVADPSHSARPKHQQRDAQLVRAFERVDQDTTWTITRTIPQTWLPAGADWEQEGLKFAGGRFYISVFDKTDNEGRLIVLNRGGTLVKDLPLPDGHDRIHPGGIDVHGHSVYIPLAVDSPNSSADILRVDTRTFRVRTLFTVGYDHVGGLTYDPRRNLLVGQDWDSRVFYEWTLHGRQVATWRNPSDYIGYQDCQYVPVEKLLCSASPLGYQQLPAFDLIDIGHAEHPLLNGVPLPAGRAGNANEIFSRRVAGGFRLTNYDASPGPIVVYTATVAR